MAATRKLYDPLSELAWCYF